MMNPPRSPLLLLVLAVLAGADTAAQVELSQGQLSQGELWIVHIGEGAVRRLDLGSGELSAPVEVGKGPHEIALCPDGRRALVPDYSGSHLTVVDLDRAAVERRIPLRRGDAPPFARPHGVAALSDGRALVTAEARQRVLDVDLATGEVDGAWNTAARMSHMVLASEDGRRAFVSNKTDGSVCVFDVATGALARTIPTGAGAQGMALRPGAGELWVGNIEADTISVVDLGELREVAELPCPDYPVRVAFTPDGSRAVVSHYRPGTVSVWDASARRLRGEVELPRLSAAAAAARPLPVFRRDFPADAPLPVGLLAHPHGGLAWVACTRGDVVVEVDLERLAVRRTFAVGREPDGMVWRRARGPAPARFVVTVPDDRGPLFLAGSFNGWQPAAPGWRLEPVAAAPDGSPRWSIAVGRDSLGELPAEFKLTRGSWDAVEVRADFADRPNRIVRAADLDRPVALTVPAWIDDRPGFVPQHAKAGVTGRLDVFEIASPRLGNRRNVRVWLPPEYEAEVNAARRYPVLYLHDGQNVFDPATSFLGVEWGADESATRLIAEGRIRPLVIVGIDHAGSARTSEYNPPFTRKNGVANAGDRYLDFVTQTVMPEIERRYRILPGPRHTGLGGASYGGNITLYAGMRHPDRFGLLLVESPVFWVFGDELMTRCSRHERWTQRVFVAIGTREAKDPRKQAGYERGMDVLRTAFAAQGLLPERARLVVEDGAVHHETAWARRFPRALEFLFAIE